MVESTSGVENKRPAPQEATPRRAIIRSIRQFELTKRGAVAESVGDLGSGRSIQSLR